MCIFYENANLRPKQRVLNWFLVKKGMIVEIICPQVGTNALSPPPPKPSCISLMYRSVCRIELRKTTIGHYNADLKVDNIFKVSNPAGVEILPEPKRRFIAQSLSCSPFHRLEMTEILLKGREPLTHPSIHFQGIETESKTSYLVRHRNIRKTHFPISSFCLKGNISDTFS